MCGIYGRVSLAGPLTPLASDHAAIRSLRHRGPDDEGSWVGPSVFLGMRRLSVIDLQTGHQPIGNEDGSIQVVYNGEIYNYQDVRRELEALGHRFATHSDTEVIVHGYEQWGPAVLDRLNGMFAIALWDQRQATLFVARDRLGVKPVYYCQNRDHLLVASEIKALLMHADTPREISPKGLLNYLSYGHAVGADTMFQGVYKLLPGHYLRVRGGASEVRAWWHPVPTAAVHITEADAAREVRRLLEDSVRLRLIADVPLGAFLSGGLDSSAVVGIMSRQMSRPVETFSMGFDLGPEYNELPDARFVSEHFRTNHHEVTTHPRELVDVLQTLVYHYDEPFGDAAAFPTYLVSRLARQHVTVALTGEGGDELFGGYRRYRGARWMRQLRLVTLGLAGPLMEPVVSRLPRFRRVKKMIEAASIPDDVARYATFLRTFSDDGLRQLLDARLEAAVESYDALTTYREHFQSAAAADDMNRLMYVDLKTWLADTYLEKVDKASMAVSLEARVPLLDYRLVEFAMTLPGSFKIQGSHTKKVLRAAVADLLPARTINKAKHGFAVPTDPWFRGELREFAREVLFDDRTRQRGLFDIQAVDQLWSDHQAGRQVRDTHLWLLLNFELWAREYLDRRAAA